MKIILSFQIPTSGDLWSVYIDFDIRRLEHWERIIPAFKYNNTIPFFEMLVPTTDTVRYGFLMEKLLAVRHSVLFTGITGVGKVRILGVNNNMNRKKKWLKRNAPNLPRIIRKQF